MAEGLDFHWKERTGDITYEKEEWRKNPSDRFRFFALFTATESNLFSSKERDWLDNHLLDIPNWEHLNPILTVLGLACLEKKRFSEEKFKQTVKASNKFTKKGVRPIDIIRYTKAWERWFREKKL